MLQQVLPLKPKEGFALTMFKLLAKEVFMREVPYEMPVKFASYTVLSREQWTVSVGSTCKDFQTVYEGKI